MTDRMDAAIVIQEKPVGVRWGVFSQNTGVLLGNDVKIIGDTHGDGGWEDGVGGDAEALAVIFLDQ